MKPEAVIFDMDDVLCRYDLGRRLRALSRLTGGADDLWDTSWRVADVNDPSFGAALSVAYTSFAGNDWPQVTDVTVTVTFTDC